MGERFPRHDHAAARRPALDRDRHLPRAPEPEPPSYEPEEIEAWWRNCREKLERRMDEEGILHGAFGEEPLSYCMELACVCAVEAPNEPGVGGLVGHQW